MKRIISNRGIIFIIVPYLIIAISLSYFLLPADVFGLESKLAEAEICRNTVLWFFDAFLWIFIIWLLIILAMLYGILKRKRQAITIVFIFLVLFMFIPTVHSYSTMQMEQRQTPLAKVVIIVTFDGTRADVFWSEAEFFIQMRNESVWARRISCTYPTETLPNHISIFSGTWPQVHGVELNPSEYRKFWLLRSYHRSQVGDIFTVAKKYGIITMMITLATIPDSIQSYPDYVYRPKNDEDGVNYLMNFLEDNLDRIKKYGLLAFLHLDEPDSNLHTYGTFSEEYRLAVKACAERVERLYNKIHQLGLENDTVIIVTADHGGYGRGHGLAFPPLVSEIPFWMWGNCIKRGVELGGLRNLDIATIASFILGIPKPDHCIGIVPYRAFNETLIKELRGIDDPLAAEKKELERTLFQEYCEILKYFSIIYVLLVFFFLVTILLKRERKKLGQKSKSFS